MSVLSVKKYHFRSDITMDEAARHNKIDDCWIVMNSKVYDVTSFLHDHPGGADILLDKGGKDATQAFEKVSHS